MNFSCVVASTIVAAPTFLSLIKPCELPLVVGAMLLDNGQCAAPLELNNLFVRLCIAFLEMLLFQDMILSGFIYGMHVLFAQVSILWLKTNAVVGKRHAESDWETLQSIA